MTDPSLERWRDHLVDSFTLGSAYTRPFKLIMKDTNRLPKLSTLEMGSKPQPVEKEPKGAKGKSKPAVKKSIKPQKAKKGKKTRGVKGKGKSKFIVSDSDSDPGSDSGSNADFEFHETSPKPPTKRRKSLRSSALKASADVNAKARSNSDAEEIAGEDQAEDGAVATAKAGSANEPKDSNSHSALNPRKRKLPGSKKGQLLSADRRITQNLASSLFLQTKAMVGGTLPNDWSCVNFSPSKVRLNLIQLCKL